jgi:photosystem II stability/assembly factor-like uncharacterized protein
MDCGRWWKIYSFTISGSTFTATEVVSGTPNNLSKIHFVTPYVGWAVGENGTLLRYVGTPVTATVSGTVTNSVTGTPVEGVTVTIGALSSVTGPDGTYSIPGVIPGVQPVTAQVNNYVDYSADITVSTPTTIHNFQMVQLATVTGTVTNSVTGNPISGVTVTIGALSSVTGLDGIYSISGVTPGSRTITAQAASYSDYSNTITVSAPTTTSNISMTPIVSGEWSSLDISSSIPGFNQDLKSVQFISDTVGWAVGTNGTIIKTTNGGNTWADISPGAGVTTQTLNAVYFINANQGWVVGNNGTFLRTTNGGTSWITTGSPSTGHHLTGVCFYNGNAGAVVGNSTTSNQRSHWRTTNGAVEPSPTWSTASGSTDNQYYFDVKRQGEIFWAQTTSTNSFVRVVYDPVANSFGSLSSSNITAIPASIQRSMSFYQNGTYGISVGDSGYTRRITVYNTGGYEWVSAGRIQNTDTTYPNMKGVSISSATSSIVAKIWAVGDGGKIFYSSDFGATWSPISSGTSNNLTSASFFDDNKGWAVGDSGTVLRYQAP